MERGFLPRGARADRSRDRDEGRGDDVSDGRGGDSSQGAAGAQRDALGVPGGRGGDASQGAAGARDARGVPEGRGETAMVRAIVNAAPPGLAVPATGDVRHIVDAFLPMGAEHRRAIAAEPPAGSAAWLFDRHELDPCGMVHAHVLGLIHGAQLGVEFEPVAGVTVSTDYNNIVPFAPAVLSYTEAQAVRRWTDADARQTQRLTVLQQLAASETGRLQLRISGPCSACTIPGATSWCNACQARMCAACEAQLQACWPCAQGVLGAGDCELVNIAELCSRGQFSRFAADFGEQMRTVVLAHVRRTGGSRMLDSASSINVPYLAECLWPVATWGDGEGVRRAALTVAVILAKDTAGFLTRAML